MIERDSSADAAGRRLEAGDLILLFHASLDVTGPDGELVGEQQSVTAKIVRLPDGEVVASTRVETTGEGRVRPAGPPRPALQREAQVLADRIVAQLRQYLAQPGLPALGAADAAENAGPAGNESHALRLPAGRSARAGHVCHKGGPPGTGTMRE